MLRLLAALRRVVPSRRPARQSLPVHVPPSVRPVMRRLSGMHRDER